MRTIAKRMIIIGLTILTGLILQTNSAYAIYSPRLSKQASIIREHLRGSQAQNGTQSILEEIEQIKAYDKAKRAAFEETGISGSVRVAQQLIFDTTLEFVIQNPFDSLYMVFNLNAPNNEWISTCLRDDIWSLETLRDMVGSEMVKAYLLRDTYHGALLMEDYKYLVSNLDLLRKYGSNPNAKIQATDVNLQSKEITSNKYFFGNEGANANYYTNILGWISDETGCPESEFQEAFREVVNSSKTLATLSSGAGAEWGSIWGMAQANARIRAKQWIQANQLSLTLGGEAGGRPISLVKGGGWDKFVGDVKTQWEVMKDLVGPVTPLFDWSLYSAPFSASTSNTTVGSECVYYYQKENEFRDCDDTQKGQFERCEENKEQAEDTENIRCDRFLNPRETISIANKLNRQVALQRENAAAMDDAQNAFTYSITIDSVAEQNIYFIQAALWDMNMNIKRGYEGVNKAAGDGIPTLTREIEALSDRQCANKQ